jgi:hypothetical protein
VPAASEFKYAECGAPFGTGPWHPTFGRVFSVGSDLARTSSTEERLSDHRWAIRFVMCPSPLGLRQLETGPLVIVSAANGNPDEQARVRQRSARRNLHQAMQQLLTLHAGRARTSTQLCIIALTLSDLGMGRATLTMGVIAQALAGDLTLRRL